MRICLVSRDYPPFPPPSRASGVGTYTHSMARALSALGHSVSVVTISKAGIRESHDGNLRTLPIIPKNYPLLWRLSRWTPVWLLEYSASVNTALQELHRRYSFDIIEFPDWGAEGFFFSRKPFCPFVVKLHGPMFLFHHYDLNPRSRLLRFFDNWIERSTAARANGITGSSRSLMSMVSRRWQIPPDRMTLIPLPLDTDVFRPAAASLSKKESTAEILYVGRLEHLKGVHILVEAIPHILQRYPNTRFTFIGNDTSTTKGRTSFKDGIIKSLRQHGAAQSVTILDQMDRTRLISFYQGSDLFVMPSLYDSVGFTGLEAMACGKPVIASSNAGFAEWVEDRVCGLVVSPGRADELARKIIHYLGLPREQRELMGVEARRVAERFSASVIAQRTADYYASIIGRSLDRIPEESSLLNAAGIRVEHAGRRFSE